MAAEEKRKRKQILTRITEEEEAVWEQIRASMSTDGEEVPFSLLVRRIMAHVGQRPDLIERIEAEDIERQRTRAAHARTFARSSAA
jgi:hypothetical protein